MKVLTIPNSACVFPVSGSIKKQTSPYVAGDKSSVTSLDALGLIAPIPRSCVPDGGVPLGLATAERNWSALSPFSRTTTISCVCVPLFAIDSIVWPSGNTAGTSKAYSRAVMVTVGLGGRTTAVT